MVAVYLIYSALLSIVFVLGSPYWLVQMARLGKYRAGLRERLGVAPSRVRGKSGRTVWIHAVSVGEVLAITRLVERLRERFGNVVISTTTHTGQKLARERFGDENVFYFPLDFAFATRAYMRALRPELVVLAETEFWPNFLRVVKQSGARIAVVNARISDRSLPRYEWFRWLMTRILRPVDLYLAQSDEDARRLVRIGAPAERVRTTGNLKFEVRARQEVPFVSWLREQMAKQGVSPVFVAGSTVGGEEEMVVDAFREILDLWPSALLVLAPRHKERFDTVAGLLARSRVRWSRRSEEGNSNPLPGSVLLLDSIGELASVFSLADVAFIGGSLVPRGGHNILEPAQAGVATLVGQHTENFRDIIRIFLQADAVRIVRRETLAFTLAALLGDRAERTRLGLRARQVLESQAGATERTVMELEKLTGGGMAVQA